MSKEENRLGTLIVTMAIVQGEEPGTFESPGGETYVCVRFEEVRLKTKHPLDELDILAALWAEYSYGDVDPDGVVSGALTKLIQERS